jgi:transcriptional regulator with XRE-family HTH domain
MSIIMDKLRTLQDVGEAFSRHRRKSKLSATKIAAQAGRSREILYRLERGEDLTVSALLDLLRAAGLAIQFTSAGLPTLEEMRERFSRMDEEDLVEDEPGSRSRAGSGGRG